MGVKIPFQIALQGWVYPPESWKMGSPAPKPSALTGMRRQILRTLMNQGDHKAGTPGLCCHANATLDQVRQARHQLHQHWLIDILHALPDKPSQSPQWLYTHTFERQNQAHTARQTSVITQFCSCTPGRQNEMHTARQTITITSVTTQLPMHTLGRQKQEQDWFHKPIWCWRTVHQEFHSGDTQNFTSTVLVIFQKEWPATIWSSSKRNGLPPSGHLSKERAFHNLVIFQKQEPSTICSSFKRDSLSQSGHLSKGTAFHNLVIFQKGQPFTVWSSLKRNSLPQSGHLSKGTAFHSLVISQKEQPSTIWSSFKRDSLSQSGHLSKGTAFHNLVIFQKGQPFTVWSSLKRNSFSQSGHLSKGTAFHNLVIFQNGGRDMGVRVVWRGHSADVGNS